MQLTTLTTDLRAHVRAHAENRPGVYRMLGPAGEVLYVGKSVKVRTRLLSYFRAKRGQKAAEIIGHAHRIEWDYAPSEFAALLLELSLIKRWRPVYNVEHKRDREFCFVKLTREWAPRLQVVGQVGKEAFYFGPFRGRTRVKEAVRELSDVLELRDCAGSTPMRFADQIELFRREAAPLCIRADLRRCLAPCAARCTRADYLERAEVARGFLEGDTDRPLAILRERMRLAAERWQFEYAAELRDRTKRLERMGKELAGLRGSIASLSFVYPVAGHGGEDRLYVVRRGNIKAEIATPRTAAEHAAADDRIRQLFEQVEPEGAAIRPHEAAEMLLVARWFRLRPEELTRTIAPERYLHGPRLVAAG